MILPVTLCRLKHSFMPMISIIHLSHSSQPGLEAIFLLFGLCMMQAQFGEEAVKARPAKVFEDKKSAAPVGDVNMIPLGQRPAKEEKKEPELDPIPDVEWWDVRILRDPQVPLLPPQR